MESSDNLKDPLLYLPCCLKILEFSKGQPIYAPEDAVSGIYLILFGSVKLTRMLGNGKQVLIDIYRTEEFFGEAALLNRPRRSEMVTAMEDTRLMVWSRQDFEELVEKRPNLALAMLRVFIQRMNNFELRMQSLAQESVLERLARALIRFSTRLGRLDSAGTMHMPALPQVLLAQYVGTSREIVTYYMTEFRRKGFLTYSRREIALFGNGLREWLELEMGRKLEYPVIHEAGETAGTAVSLQHLLNGREDGERLRSTTAHLSSDKPS